MGESTAVCEILSTAGILCLTSKYEGLPLSIIEGMAAGLPVVASDVGGVGELIVEGETGHMVPVEDPLALRRVLQALLDSPQERERLGANGRRRFERMFRSDAMISRIRSVYFEALSQATQVAEALA